MSSSRRIFSVIVTTGLFSMGTSALLANGGDHDRGLANQTQYYQDSSANRGLNAPIDYSIQAIPVMPSRESHR